MSKFKRFINDSVIVSMPKEQEKLYGKYRAERILRYDKFFLFMVIAFELYNLIYALIYTGGQLKSVSSKVYVVLYSILLIVSGALLIAIPFFIKKLPKSSEKIIVAQTIYACFILVWAAAVTVYDQRVSDNLSVYYIIALSVAILASFKPYQAILSFGIVAVLLCFCLPIFAKDHASDYYGEIFNLIVLTIMCVFINVYVSSYDRRNFIYRQLITEKNSKLQYFADNDTLTGLRSRRFLDVEMDGLYKECFEKKTPLTFMMMDIDSFKSYNDRFGHVYGDECLRRVACRIQSELNANSEFLIRYGGEEFLYVGKNVNAGCAKNKAQLFNTIVRELAIGPNPDLNTGVTISVGVYTEEFVRPAHKDWHSCVDDADKALYRAKNSGKDRCVFANDID